MCGSPGPRLCLFRGFDTGIMPLETASYFYILKKNSETLTDASKEVDLEVNAKKSICCRLVDRGQSKR
jgi:hypothetical protein